MDINPLPNLDCDSSDSDSTIDLLDDNINYYVARITSCEKFTFEQLKNQMSAEYQICRYVIGKETVPQEHYHLVLGVDDTMKEIDVRDIIKAFLIPLWQNEGKLPKGFGNKQYNLQVCEDLDKAVSYAVKCKDYVFEGFDEEYIKARQSESFEKKKVSNFKTEYAELCKEFQETQMDLREFMIKYCLLKSKYGQQVRAQDAYGYAMSNWIQRDPEKAEDFVENFLYKL